MTDPDLSSIYSGGEVKQNVGSANGKKIKIRLLENLLGQHLQNKQWVKDRTTEEWIQNVFKSAAFYEGLDELLWGNFLICIYKDPSTDKISSLVIDKLGVTHFNPVDLSSKSQYYPAIENLDPKDRDSNVKKCIAVSLLKKFAQLSEDDICRIEPAGLKFDYDPTHAGDLASASKVVGFCTPENVGKSLVSLGFLQHRCVQSTLLDVVYEHSPSTTESNNRMVFNLGEQLEQLFEPLNEYSPEQTEYTYKSPENESCSESDNVLVKAILNELLQLQTNFTLNLVEFLQGFLICLRVRVLNEEIEGLSTMKLNRLFPPTIDEVTRINCIFLDSLKSATPYGSLEVLKACSVTIPYFYKAYTRHEAATKNFSKDIKLFLKKFQDKIPQRDSYTEMKIETIIKGPQEKLLKLKLIIERLYSSKEWSPAVRLEATKYYENIIDVVDSFGRLEAPMSSYSTRVFTPSGKILTELAKGWPVELQYKWLKRRVVGVFDVVDSNDMKRRQLLVIFSDYVVFLDIDRADLYYSGNDKNRPQIADILMNSLINEVPLPPKIPKLTVSNYCYIDKIFVSLLEGNALRFDALEEGNTFSITFKLATNSISASNVAELIVKAKILEKETAFHLFKAARDDITIYSTAHELEAYRNERIKSKFCVFLNMEPSKEILYENQLHLAFFLKFVSSETDEQIQLDIMSSDNRCHVTTVLPVELVPALLNELATEIPVCYSSINSTLLSALMVMNENLVKKIGHDFNQLSVDTSDEAKPDSSFTPDHEKKKSFGTITTYRSHASDLKDVTSENKKTSKTNHRERKRAEPHMDTKVPPKKSAIAETKPPKIKKQETRKKRKSFVDVFKGIFSGRNGKGRPKQNTNPVKGYSPRNHVKTSDRAAKSLAKVSAPQMNAAAPKGGEPKVANFEQDQRISSVIRNSEFSSTLVSNARQENPHKMGQEPLEEKMNATHVLPQEEEKNMNFAALTSAPSTQEERKPSENIGTIEGKGANVSFYQQSTRQSQLFNDDLYGELVTDKADRPKEPEESEVSKNSQREIRKDGTAEEAASTCQRNTLPVQIGVTAASSYETSAGERDKTGGIEEVGNNEEIASFHSKSMEVHDTENLPHDDLEKKVESGDENTNVRKSEYGNKDKHPGEKEHIFPSIPAMKLSQVSIQRSTSFIELFKGMRLILDESDAQYNWRRLSSEASFLEPSSTDGKGTEPHAFKMIAIANTSSPYSKANESTRFKAPAVQDSKTEVTSGDKTIPAKQDGIGSSHIDMLQAGVVDTFENFAIDKDIVADASHVAKPSFKVVKSSPTRIIRKPLQQLNVEQPDHSVAYNFSISSDLNQITDKRWFELKLPSQEDLQSEIFHTPTDEPSSQFAEDLQRTSASPSPFESNANETSQDTITSNEDVSKNPNAMLEDLEFSSFRMTFDNSGNEEDSAYVTSPDATGVSARPLSPFLEQRRVEPLFYHLPDDLVTTSNTISRIRGTGKSSNEEDGPIWISPSKLDFYDLSKVAEPCFQPPKREAARNVNERNEPVVNGKRVEDETGSLRELSYAYLASLVSPNDCSFDADDRPVRLQFEG